MHIVIGSGPAGVSAASSLLAKGEQVTMLDVGYTLEDTRRQMVEKLRATQPQDWDSEAIRSITENTQPDVKGLPKKLIFGSDYPFRHPESVLGISSKDVEVLLSHAAGGLSAVWGANMLPLLHSDVANWPITVDALEPYYRKVLTFVNLSARRDGLEKLFPLHTDHPDALSMSKQARALLDSMEPHREKLATEGVHFGASRLAVRAGPSKDDLGCTYCGLCLYGCPYGLIYNAAFTLEQLKKNENFKYISRVFVERVEEQGTRVKVHAVSLPSGGSVTFSGDRVFVGAGAVSSSRIILESMEAYNEELLIRDSQYFLAPFLRLKGSGDVTKESLHTLSQLAINIRSDSVSEKSVHVLAYTYNDLYLRAVNKLFGPLALPARPFVKLALSRMIILQGYLHSDDSASIALRVAKPRSIRREITLEARENPRSKEILKKLFSFMGKRRGITRGMILTPMAHIGAPGKSYHVGASIPMRFNPGRFESDTLGRPSGFSRVHLVDPSIFPDVPATNATFTIMANAYRIAETA